MSVDEEQWLSLSEASRLLGVHYTTLRRWADAGDVPCFRTPGGHRRFRARDLATWLGESQSVALVPAHDALVRSALGFARQEMVEQRVARERWHAAFAGEDERREMGEMGRSLFGLAIRYLMRMQGREQVLQEGQRIGRYYGQQCAERSMPLLETVRAFIFFRRSLLQAVGPGQAGPGQYDAEDARIQRSLNYYMDEVMCACLDSYQQHSRRLSDERGEE